MKDEGLKSRQSNNLIKYGKDSCMCVAIQDVGLLYKWFEALVAGKWRLVKWSRMRIGGVLIDWLRMNGEMIRVYMRKTKWVSYILS